MSVDRDISHWFGRVEGARRTFEQAGTRDDLKRASPETASAILFQEVAFCQALEQRDPDLVAYVSSLLSKTYAVAALIVGGVNADRTAID